MISYYSLIFIVFMEYLVSVNVVLQYLRRFQASVCVVVWCVCVCLCVSE